MDEPDSEKTSGDGFAELLRAAQAGEAESLDELLRQTYAPVVDFLRRRFGERQLRNLAEDVAIETLIRVAAHLRSCRAENEAGYWTWVLTIAKNEGLRVLRSTELRKAEVLAPATLESLAEARAAAQARFDLEVPEGARQEAGTTSAFQTLLPLLEPLVRGLSEPQQMLLGLRYVEGWTYGEIAVELETTAPAAKRRVQRIHARLLRELREAVNEFGGPNRDQVAEAFRLLEQTRESG